MSTDPQPRPVVGQPAEEVTPDEARATVLHHLEAYRDAVEAWELEISKKGKLIAYRRARANLSAVHARAKGSS